MSLTCGLKGLKKGGRQPSPPGLKALKRGGREVLLWISEPLYWGDHQTRSDCGRVSLQLMEDQFHEQQVHLHKTCFSLHGRQKKLVPMTPLGSFQVEDIEFLVVVSSLGTSPFGWF